MFGLLNIDKPVGVTSRDVVNRVQRLVRPLKVGHAGTLDPLATGVLVVGIGAATRLVEFVQRMPKTYRGTFLLGQSSDTEDIEGNVTPLASPPQPTRAEIEAVLPRFVGRIQQTPPAYSALKVAGRRAYDLARRGNEVRLEPREIEVFAIDLIAYLYPQLELLIRCGSGTYVRSLGRDIARALGTDAVMSALRREAIGPFAANAACRYEGLSRETIESNLLPPELALGEMPRVVLTSDEVRRLLQGQAIADRFPEEGQELAALTASQQLVAVLTRDSGQLRPEKCFPPR